jgi:hypothetical protein
VDVQIRPPPADNTPGFGGRDSNVSTVTSTVLNRRYAVIARHLKRLPDGLSVSQVTNEPSKVQFHGSELSSMVE